MNRENMEKWIQALETHQGKQAKGIIMDGEGNVCAMGVGLLLINPELVATNRFSLAIENFRYWIGYELFANGDFDLPLKNGDNETTVTQANDRLDQDFWTIAQRLRETYLKDES